MCLPVGAIPGIWEAQGPIVVIALTQDQAQAQAQ